MGLCSKIDATACCTVYRLNAGPKATGCMPPLGVFLQQKAINCGIEIIYSKIVYMVMVSGLDCQIPNVSKSYEGHTKPSLFSIYDGCTLGLLSLRIGCVR